MRKQGFGDRNGGKVSGEPLLKAVFQVVGCNLMGRTRRFGAYTRPLAV
jgi:hypothetical protein